MNLTRNEIIILVLLGLLIAPVALTPQQTIRNYEEFCLVGALVPLGILLLTDTERMKKG